MATWWLGGLVCLPGVLCAMPALTATASDRTDCAGIVDKPDVGIAACSRIIDDPGETAGARVEAYANRGRVHFNSKDFDRAIADYGEAIKLDPNAPAYVRRGMPWTEKGEFDSAIADLTQAVTIDPNYAAAWAGMARPMNAATSRCNCSAEGRWW